MLNMIEPGRDRTRQDPASAAEARPGLERPAPGRSRAPGRQRSGLGGRASTSRAPGRTGWSGRRRSTRRCRTAAKAIASTGRPVGLLMWRGRHAWVMSGFTRHRRPAARPTTSGSRGHRPRPALSARLGGLGPEPATGRGPQPAQLGRQFVPRSMTTSGSAVGQRSCARQVRAGAALRGRPHLWTGSRRSRPSLDARNMRAASANRATASGVVGSSAAMTWPVPSAACAASPAAISSVVPRSAGSGRTRDRPWRPSSVQEVRDSARSRRP